MSRLFVLYDSGCGFCLECRQWLGRQAWLVDLEFVAAHSILSESLFPDLSRVVQPNELTVVSDGGEIWTGPQAWLMCLWALRYYREWSYRLASPALLPFARQAFALVSRNRTTLSHWLRFFPEARVAEELGKTEGPSCTRVPPVAFGPGAIARVGTADAS